MRTRDTRVAVLTLVAVLGLGSETASAQGANKRVKDVPAQATPGEAQASSGRDEQGGSTSTSTKPTPCDATLAKARSFLPTMHAPAGQ
jgi:hypothetical protein